jgi:hypothetical protein
MSRAAVLHTPTVAALLAAMLAAGVPPAQAEGRRFAFGDDNVPGWALMSSAERAAHHQKLMAMHSLEECRAYMAEHDAGMAQRAAARGKQLRPARFDVCEELKRRKLID